jgi:hypothetical protein
MRHRLWITAALASSGCLLLLLTAAAFPVATKAPQSSQSSTGPADLVLAAGEDPAAPSAGANENQQPGNLPTAPSATILDNREGRGILGSAVRSATNEDMGRVVDVIVDRAGTARAAVIDFGGFLGVGSRKIAVDWSAMRFAGSNGVSIDLTRDQVRTAPQYQEGKPIMVLGAAPEFARSRVTARIPEQ